jgi:hypothetical protein
MRETGIRTSFMAQAILFTETGITSKDRFSRGSGTAKGVTLRGKIEHTRKGPGRMTQLKGLACLNGQMGYNGRAPSRRAKAVEMGGTQI